MSFLGLTFLSPLFLVGIASAAIPLILHLSRSRRTKKMSFSTTRFFTDQFLRSYRMSRLKEWLLLICRMLLFGLLAIALARPLFLPTGTPTLMAGSRAIVLVIDPSASMSHRVADATLMERVKQAGRDILDGLQPGDRASIILAARRDTGPEVVFDPPTEQLADVRQALSDVDALTLGADLSDAVRRAEQIVRSSTASNKEVYILSDLQDAGWEVRESDESGSADVSFTFVRIRPEIVDNLAITAIQYSAARPMIGVPFEFKPFIAMQGPRDTCEVRLIVDGKTVSERTIERPVGTMFATPRLHHAFTTPGWHWGYIEVVDDVLPLDNRRYFAFEIVERVRVLAVNGAPSQVPHLDELVYLRAALNVTDEEDGRSPFEVVSITPAEWANLTNEEWNQYALIVLANVESLPLALVDRLESFTDAGGRLLVFLGDQVHRDRYNEALANRSRRHGGLLPGPIRPLAGDPQGSDGYATIGDVDTTHLALAAFADAKFANLNTVRLKALWDVDAGDATVCMRASTGVPLLLEKVYGRGRVMLFTSSIDRDWSNFPVRPAFLPWTHRIIGYLAQDPLGRDKFFTTGQPLSLPAPPATNANVPIIVQRPQIDGRPGTMTGYPTPDADDPTLLRFGDTDQAGIYTITRGQANNRPAFSAVNLESYESDLTYLDDVFADAVDAPRLDAITLGMRGLLPGVPSELVRYVDDPLMIGEVASTSQRGSKLWDVVLMLVLALALLEPLLANWISLRHYGKPKDVSLPRSTRSTEVTAS